MPMASNIFVNFNNSDLDRASDAPTDEMNTP